MDKFYKISVIIPVYNAECHIAAALDSVLSQDADVEVIAVDDGSKDGSLAILNKYAARDSRVKPIFVGENMGVAHARNLALAAASGDYVAFCDADDTVPDGAYRELISAVSGRDVAIGAYCNVDERGTEGDYMPLTKRERSSVFLSVFSVSCLWNKLIRRDFLLKNRLSFDTSMTIGEDVVFLAELVMCRPSYAVTDKLVYRHFQNTASLVHTYTLDALKKHIECRKRLLSICGSMKEAEDFVYIDFSGFLKEFLMNMNIRDIPEAFSLYREHMLKYDYYGSEALFERVVGIPKNKFLSCPAGDYFKIMASIPPRERVLSEFKSGGIGLVWIMKYLWAWIKYKLSKK